MDLCQWTRLRLHNIISLYLKYYNDRKFKKKQIEYDKICEIFLFIDVIALFT